MSLEVTAMLTIGGVNEDPTIRIMRSTTVSAHNDTEQEGLDILARIEKSLKEIHTEGMQQVSALMQTTKEREKQ